MRIRRTENEKPQVKGLCVSEAATVNSFCFYLPQSPLSRFIERFWYWKGHTVSHSQERILPTGTVELVIDLGSPRTSKSVVSGPRSKSSIIQRSAQDELLGIHFQPGGAFPFLKFPFGDLHNIAIGIDDLWGEEQASELLDLLDHAEGTERQFQILETWMMKSISRPLHHHPAVTFAIAELERNPNLSMSQFAAKVNLSQRRFIETFSNEVGLTPKLFSRIQRFNRVVRSAAFSDDVDWSELAMSFGYFDQAHLIHDFREFSSLTPTEYLGLRTEHLRHIRVADSTR
jgi:AraC-like DNA-binding protein